MYLEDINGSIAYANCLKTINLLTDDELKQICDGLNKIQIEWDNDTFTIKEDEDIHSANERRLKVIVKKINKTNLILTYLINY